MDNQRAINAAIRLALGPVVRLLLAGGVMYQDAAALLRKLYVDVATRDYGVRGRPTNASRVALLTGLDRKEIRRLRSAAADSPAPRPAPDRLSRILSAWHQDSAFAGNDGRPLALPRTGAHPSFESLVERYGGDVPATAIAKELERGGAIEQQDDGRLQPRTRYFMVRPFDETAVLRSGDVLADLGNTVYHNLTRAPEEASWFEGRATNRHVAADACPAFREFLEREAETFLERVDQWLTDHESADESRSVRLGLGLYAIHGPADTLIDKHEA